MASVPQDIANLKSLSFPVSSSLLWRFLAVIVAGMLFLVVAALIIFWQVSVSVENDAQQQLSRAVGKIERIFDSVQLAALTVMPLAGEPCNPRTLAALRHQVVAAPSVRSLNLVQDGILYCSSVNGPLSGQLDLSRYTEERLRLMDGNRTTPDSALLVYRVTEPRGTVLVGIDGKVVRDVLELLSPVFELRFNVGDSWLDTQGKVYSERPATDKKRYRLASKKYPFSISTRVDFAIYRAHLWRSSHASVVLFILLGVLVGLLAWRRMSKIMSPLARLNHACQRQQFIPYIQPIVTSASRQLIGCEVLMRWHHPRLGMVAPDRFIPLAEESGLIIPMTRSLMRQVREYFRPLRHRLPENFHFGFNISARHFSEQTLIDDCSEFLAAFAGQNIALVLEITERQLIVDTPQMAAVFSGLHQMGVLIALDDFGTGHSSLSYLQKFKIDCLKIDLSFIQKIGDGALSNHIVDNVISLAKQLKMTTVAEGVETEAQQRYLASREVDYLQGYLFSRPQPMELFGGQWLQDQ